MTSFLAVALTWLYRLAFWLVVAGAGVQLLTRFHILPSGFQWLSEPALYIGALGWALERFKVGVPAASPVSPAPPLSK